MKAFAIIILTAICTWLLISFVSPDVLDNFLEDKTPTEKVIPKVEEDTWEIKVGEIDEEELERLLFQAINRYRMGEGVDSVPLDEYWQKKAKEHSQRMAETGTFEHSTLNNYENLFLYIGYEKSEEIICQKAMESWKKSAGHNANLINRSLNFCGLGAVQEGTCTYVTFMAR